MKNYMPAMTTAKTNGAQNKLRREATGNPTSHRWKIVRTLSVSLLLSGIALVPMVNPFAQNKEGTVKVTGVISQKSGDGTVVTISADAPLTRTQTWQDEEGFHLVMPGASPGGIKGLPRGVTVRNLGRSLEVVVAVKSGAGVTVDPRFNHLNLIVPGGVDTTHGEAELDAPSSRPQVEARTEAPRDYAPQVRQSRAPRTTPNVASISPAKSSDINSAKSTEPKIAQPAPAPSSSQTTALVAAPPVAPQVSATPAPAPPQLVPATGNVPATADANNSSVDGGIFSYLFSTTGIVILVIVLLGLLILYRRRKSEQGFEDVEVKNDKDKAIVVEYLSTDVATTEGNKKKEQRKYGRRKNDQAIIEQSANGKQELELRAEVDGAMEKRSVAPVQPTLYGAYRVDQEVGKLILGQAHRMDVLASRAPDDRRAIETSLLKALNSPEAGDDGRRKAREALEEYGFVARQCASLLLSHNAYDRASSARVLGEISSQASFPFLLEALYDTEGIVRTEAVTSLGALKMPSAIGALLDMARRHPEMPAPLLSRALSACSVECFDFFDTPVMDRPLLDVGDHSASESDMIHLAPVAAVEELPDWFDDEELSDALARLQGTDVETRAAAVRQLSQFHAQRSVEALTTIAANDPEPTVRAAAVTSLGEIEHESVFAPIMMAFADEAREVRASAARSLSRLNFDRAEGFVRLIDNADEETLRKVAQACTKAGMVAQAIERLISEDRRLAYEAFSLLSLLVKSGETEPLVDAITSHPEINVRLAVIRLLGTATRPEVATLLRHLVVRDGLPEKVRSVLMEVVYQVDQAQPV
jgi:HEAT repeat protein